MHTDTPISKVGAVVVRERDGQVLIVRPIAKRAGETPPFVLPRGTRQYYDSTTSVWIDARSEEQAVEHVATLEPLSQTLLREAEEEAGIPPAVLQRDGLEYYELGPRMFQSTTKGTYPVYWFLMVLNEADVKQLAPVPADATEAKWVSIDEAAQLARDGAFSPGYIPIIQEAFALLHAR